MTDTDATIASMLADFKAEVSALEADVAALGVALAAGYRVQDDALAKHRALDERRRSIAARVVAYTKTLAGGAPRPC